ncbi:MAG: exodeoxyribonuclease VII small subunit [Ruminococcus sp.]|nr:exodeoxyribonuclease VII small subunit [Ruminococcus sp.]
MKNSETTFEENLKRLGEIAEVLEKGEIPLEKAVEFYSESVKIASLCRKQLDDAKIKITEDGREIMP